MRRALIVSRNLIGDALCAGVAIREFFKQKLKTEDGFDVIDLLTIKDHVTVLYKGIGVEWSNVFTNENHQSEEIKEGEWEYDKIYTIGAGDAGKYADDHQCHIIEGFCDQLGIEPPQVDILTNQLGTFKAWKPFYKSPSAEAFAESLSTEDELILFSPFSASCASRKGGEPNKMLKPDHWVPLIDFMRTLGPIRMLGAPDDLPHESWQLSEEEVMTYVPLDWLAAVMKKAKLVITIDNGMGHLADSQDAPHILFYPMCLGLHFILSWGANHMVPIQLEPSQAQATQIMSSVRRAARQLGVTK
jgi:ADP-heptose:LPS heptosyltransferase